MNLPAKAEVLVVGAGPTGLMLANQLVRRGIDTVIIDRHAGPSIETRALGVQARTLEIYSQLGIADQALELGMRATGANIWVGGRRAARLPLGDIGRNLSPYPFLLILGQDANERLLGEDLNKRGGKVHWNTELIALEQREDNVLADLKQGAGSIHQINARWVGGCDGARSSVRELNRIAFPGAPYQHMFFVADTSVTGSLVPDELNVYLSGYGFNLFFPMRGENHWRIVGILPRELTGRDDLNFDDVMPSINKHAGISFSIQECRWFSTYRIHHRHAERFQDRRCFLLGDAAHIHSPVGAQGMNTGLQDAYNLAWKLALVSSGRADEILLQSYEKERLPVANKLLKTTDNAFSLIVSDRWSSKILRTRVIARVMGFAMRFDRIKNLAFRTISQIGIHYRGSYLSETLAGLPDDAPHAGDRFPWMRLKFSPQTPAEDLFARLDDSRFNLILIGQPPVAFNLPELDGLLLTHVVLQDSDNEKELARARIPNPSFYLLRPDGHVGSAGKILEPAALSQYIAQRLKLRKPGVFG